MFWPTKNQYINIHSHRKAMVKDEWVLRNAFHLLSQKAISKLKYAVSIGLHPWMVKEKKENDYLSLVSLENVLAIGEAGLDRFVNVDFSLQTERLHEQLIVAEKLNKPVVLHIVKAYSDIIPFVKKYKVPFVFHQFRGNLIELNQLLKHSNAYFSYGKDLVYNNSKAIQSFLNTPNNRFFLETDNSSVTIDKVYQKAGELKQIEIDNLKYQVFHNFASVFGI